MLANTRPYRAGAMVSALLLLVACGSATPPADTQQAAAPAAPVATVAPIVTVAPTIATPAPLAAKSSELGISEEGAEASVDTSGEYVSDIGFRPDANGFSFPNYGGDEGFTGLAANDVWRLFGDSACAWIEGEECILTPAGEQWMQEINQAMGGGHCEGMAVLSKLFYTGKLDVNEYGASSVPDLTIEGNEALQREIAYWWATQTTQPARTGIVQQTPSGVVNTLLTALEAGPAGSETYAVGFYKRDGTGGHAVTPYAVEDRGDGIYWIMVYDNNYPGAARAIEVDTNNDTWSYEGSTNPDVASDLYEGDAESLTLELAALEPRLDVQECPFCAASAEESKGEAAQSDVLDYNEIYFDGDADLLITDADGRKVGFENGVWLNEIPGATSNANKFGVSVWDENAEPVYYIPTDVDFTIEINGSQLSEASEAAVTMIGPGYVLEVEEIMLEPGQIDTLDVSPDGSLLSYRSGGAETPVLYVGIETDAADYLFGVYGEEVVPGEAINLSLNTDEAWLSIDTIDNIEASSISLGVVKIDDAGEQVFVGEGIVLDPDDVVYVDYLEWPGNGQQMELDYDQGGDGTVDDTVLIDDVTDTIEE